MFEVNKNSKNPSYVQVRIWFGTRLQAVNLSDLIQGPNRD